MFERLFRARRPARAPRPRRLRGVESLESRTLLSAAPLPVAPPLPAPTGNVVRVSTVGQLQAAVDNLTSDTTILVAPGTYNLTSTLRVNGGIRNVAIRGATGDRDDVVIVGKGMKNASYGSVASGLESTNVDGLLIADLTMREFYHHPIAFNAGTENPHVYNVHLVNAGQQFIKSNPDGKGGGVDGGVVEYSLIEYAATARSSYTNGVDVHTGAGWVIRNNTFRNIRAPAGGGLAGPAILVWNGSRDTLVEGNQFYNSQRGIAFGMNAAKTNDHEGGVIRNNFFHRAAGQTGDVPISLANSAGSQVLHNTVFVNGTFPWSIEYRFRATTGVQIRGNLTDGTVQRRDGASASALDDNVTNAQKGWFVDAAAGDLHLTPAAFDALDRVTSPAVTVDYDGQVRPQGKAAEAGADEVGFSSSDVVVDNSSSGVAIVGTWTSSTAVAGYYGGNFLHDGNVGKEAKSVRFTPALAAPGTYEVFARWTSGANRAASVPYDVIHNGVTTTVHRNQQTNGGDWVSLGSYQFSGNGQEGVLLRTGGTSGYVVADAVRFHLASTISAPTEFVFDNASSAAVQTGTWQTSAATPGYYGTNYWHDGNSGKGTKSVTFTPNLAEAGAYEVFARWPADPNRATNVPIDVTHSGGTTTVLRNQRLNGNAWVSLGTYDFAAGAGSVRIRTAGTNGYVVVDAVKFVRVDAPVAAAAPEFATDAALADRADLSWVDAMFQAAAKRNALPSPARGRGAGGEG